MPVKYRGDAAEGTLIAFVVCAKLPYMGRIPVPLFRAQRYRVDLNALAEMLAGELDTDGSVQADLEGRLWWLGRATFRAGKADVFMARGLGQEGGADAVGSAPRFRQCSRAVLLSLCDTPRDLFPEKVTASLPRLLSFRDHAVRLDVEVLGAEVTRRFGGRSRQIAKYPTPPGTAWEQVEIVILADADGAIINAGAEAQDRTPDQMGMAYERNPKRPTKLWDLLLRFAAEEKIGPGSRPWDDNIPKRVERLRHKLREMFGIDEDPFKPYHEVRGYEPRFMIRRAR